jgi:hypothetical protein
VLFDRYTETHRAAAQSQLGWRLDEHALLAPYLAADRTFWLELDPAEALRRLELRGEPLSADEHAVGLAGYAEAFAAMATSPADVGLDARAPFAANAARIAATALPLTPAAGPREGPGLVTLAPAATRAQPLEVAIGAGAGVVLGGDIAVLAGWLRQQIGARADAVPLAFWVEAYAAQLVIDARTTGSGAAVVPLWPEALRRMPLFADLPVLDDLVHLVDAAVQVRALAPAAPSSPWETLVPSPAARRRLQSEYEVALQAVARERGWDVTGTARPLIRVA